MPDQTAEFDEWCVVELLGHRRVAGRVREATIAGAGLLRIDIPDPDGGVWTTQYVGPGAVYAIHPTAEPIARAIAERYIESGTVYRWEMPAALAPDPWDADDGRPSDAQLRDEGGYGSDKEEMLDMEWAGDDEVGVQP